MYIYLMIKFKFPYGHNPVTSVFDIPQVHCMKNHLGEENIAIQKPCMFVALM